MPTYVKQSYHTGKCSCKHRVNGHEVHRDISDDPEHYMCCKQYAKEIIERHNEIQFATKNFLTYAFEVINEDNNNDDGDCMEEGEIASSDGKKGKTKAIVHVHMEKAMAKTILDKSNNTNEDEEVLLEKVITDLSAEKNAEVFGFEPRQSTEKENISDADARYIHFDITVTHAASRSKVQTLKTHLGSKAAEVAEKKKIEKYQAARGNSQGFMDRFTPIAFESSGNMGPITKALFESQFAKFGFDSLNLKVYKSYYRWFCRRVSIICATYLYKIYYKFINDVIRRG